MTRNVHLQASAKPRELVVHSRCHPTEGTWVVLETGGRNVRLECVACRKVVMTLRLESPETDREGDIDRDLRATGADREQARRARDLD